MLLGVVQRLTSMRQLGNQAHAILIQSSDFFLLDDDSLLRLTQFSLNLLNLLLVPAQILVALLLDRLPVMFERFVRMPVFLFEGFSVGVVLGQALLQIGDLLFGRVARDRFLLQRLARAPVRFPFLLQGRFQALELRAQLLDFPVRRCQRFNVPALLVGMIGAQRIDLNIRLVL